jgi:hypothetical protein
VTPRSHGQTQRFAEKSQTTKSPSVWFYCSIIRGLGRDRRLRCGLEKAVPDSSPGSVTRPNFWLETVETSVFVNDGNASDVSESSVAAGNRLLIGWLGP